MYEGRLYTVKRKPRIILDRRFPAINGLGIGDKGQLLLSGIIDSERIENEDMTDVFYKTITVTDVEIINNKELRI